MGELLPQTDVLIVGGGPVGLGLGIELVRRGIRAVVIEKHETIHSVPKGQNLTQRTGEHFQAWGVSGQIREASVIPREFGSFGLTSYGSLTSGICYDWFNRSGVREFYAADNERLPQYVTERVLRRRLTGLGGDLLLGCEVVSLRQSEEEVELGFSDPRGARRKLRARFAVGCDGSHSSVRRLAGITQSVDDHSKRMGLMVFRSERLDRILDRYPGKSFFHIMRPHLQGYWQFLGRVDLDGTWFYHSPVETGKIDHKAHLQDAVGGEFDVDLLYSGFWDLRFAVVDNFRRGRVFVAGDAAHSHPPYGGFGINLGFEDARNLGWKLAAELAGWAGADLLQSYNAERRGVFVSTADDFILRMIQDDAEFLRRFSPDRDSAEFAAAWQRRADGGDADVVEYCPHYSGSPIVAANSGPGPGAKGRHRHDAIAGAHLSPQRLADGGMSSERLGDGFTLIGIGISGEHMLNYGREAEAAGIPMAGLELEASESTGRWNASVILVRPDHFVAFASKRPPDSIGTWLRRSVGSAE
ncbi:MAG: FAD-dependent monooxygenase [Rhodobacteraceae bacterium]|nr:FAD-dependent monooxygenase [Paracoccaceae bacterium]